MFGFVKVCAATPQIQVADIGYNTKNIISAIDESLKHNTELIVFPELSICGYTCGDLFNQRRLLESVKEGLKAICDHTKDSQILVFVGAPIEYMGRLYNCAVAMSGGRFLGVVPKSFLPTYGEFYEKRHFSSAPQEMGEVDLFGFVPFGKKIIFKADNFSGFTVSAEICEDLWTSRSPSNEAAVAGANIIVNLSCSDETVGKADYRRDLVKMQSGRLVCGYVYSDSGDGESTTDMVFAGHNIIAENASVLAESKLFENGLIYAEIDVEMLSNERKRMSSCYYAHEVSKFLEVEFKASQKERKIERNFAKQPFVPQEKNELSQRSESILLIQQKGLEKRLLHTNAKSAVIGISGGLDSALALLVTLRAFKGLNRDLKDIIAVTMPGFGTTKKTKSNSVKLIEALKVSGREIDITDSVLQHFKDIGHDKNELNVTYENAQARTRTLILMDIANKTGGLVIGTGDLSELALGWSTYNGDHMSMYGVNCSIPKTLVKYLIAYEAKKYGGEIEKILNDILDTEISPELLPPDKDGKIAQKTEDLVGPYVLHDFFLYYVVRFGFEPKKVEMIANQAFNGEFDGITINKWLKNFYKRFFANQFKRSCIPDGVKVGSVALSPRGDWRMPSDAVAKIWLDELD